MPKYNVDTAFWRKGELLAVDSEVTMTIAEAKYLKHAISEKGAKAAQPVEAVAAEPEPVRPIAYAAVEEQPSHGKRRRQAE